MCSNNKAVHTNELEKMSSSFARRERGDTHTHTHTPRVSAHLKRNLIKYKALFDGCSCFLLLQDAAGEVAIHTIYSRMHATASAGHRSCVVGRVNE